MSESNHSMSSFTRGSQIFMHTLRMMGQGAKAAFCVSLFLLGGWLFVRCSQKIYLKDFYYLFMERWATIKLDIGSIVYPANQIKITVYDFLTHKIRVMSAIEFKNRIWQSQVGARLESLWQWVINQALLEAAIIFSSGLALTYGFFVLRGRESMGKKKTRGGELIASKELRSRLKKAGVASDIIVGKLPIINHSGLEVQSIKCGINA